MNAQTYDELLADLHYADAPAYATGHGVSAAWDVSTEGCLRVWHLLDAVRVCGEDKRR